MSTILTDDERRLLSAAMTGKPEDIRAIEAAVLAKLREQEPIYQYQMNDGTWIDQTRESYEYNLRNPTAKVRVVYAAPLPAVVQVPQQTAKPVRYAFFAGDGEVLFEPDPNGNWVRYSEVMGALK